MSNEHILLHHMIRRPFLFAVGSVKDGGSILALDITFAVGSVENGRSILTTLAVGSVKDGGGVLTCSIIRDLL